MRVLMVHSRYRQRGGEDVAVETEIAALQAAGIEVVPFFGDNAMLTGRSAFAASLHALWAPEVLRQLRQVVADTRPDVMHVHNTFPGLSAAVYRAARLGGHRLPLVQSLHNFRLFCANALLLRDGAPCTLCLKAPLAWPGIRHGCYQGSPAGSAVVTAQAALHRLLGARYVTRYLALSQASRAMLIVGGLPAARILVKPNIIPDPGAIPAPQPRRGLLFVGRLAPEKGLDTLLRALHGLNLPLAIAGAGPEEAALRRLAPAHVEWLGAITPAEVSARMRQAALLVFPSRAFENYPMALAEAMAHGLPVLASDRGAMREMVRPGETGWLVPPDDMAAWRQAMVDLLQRPADLAAAGQTARARYLAELSPARLVQQQLEIYRLAMEAAA